MDTQALLAAYPLKVKSAIIVPLAQRQYFSGQYTLPDPTLSGMYFVAEKLGVPPSSVRVTLSRMCREGGVTPVQDDTGTTRYRMGPMLRLVSEQAARFGRGEGLTLAVFRFRKEEEKQRYRVRELLASFGFKKLAQNVYLALQVDSQRVARQFAALGLQEHVFLFDCPQAADDESIAAQIRSLWRLDEWEERLARFYAQTRPYLRLDGLPDEEVYIRYSIAYSIFFTHFYEKRPAVPARYFPQGRALDALFALLEETVRTYGETIVRFYRGVNR